jgi:tripartite-type tricarboxylate transporter receptor subunit TctC
VGIAVNDTCEIAFDQTPVEKGDKQMKKIGMASVLSSFLMFVFQGSAARAADTYPAKPITIVAPFAAGGSVDVTTRIVAEAAEKHLGQKILIVNKPGAGGVEGQGFVARSAPDGYTLVALSGSFLGNVLTKKVDFSIDSFTYIALYSIDPSVMLVAASSPFKSVKDVVEAAKKGPVSFCTPGHSTGHHMVGLLLEDYTGVKFKYIHTKGGAEQMPMIAGGHVQCGTAAYGEASSLVEMGKIRVVGVSSDERDPRFPNVPTYKELGYPVERLGWRGVAGPKGLSPEVLNRLSAAFKAALDSKDVKERFAKADYPLANLGSTEFTAHVKKEYESTKRALVLLDK